MKKFKFELEDLLTLRKFEQEETQIELGKAVGEEKKIQDKLELLAREQVNTVKQTEGSLDFNAINNQQNYLLFLRQQKDYLLEELTKAKLVTEEKRKIFYSAFQKAEALSKIKDKQYESYQMAENAEEENFVDDIVTASNNRN